MEFSSSKTKGTDRCSWVPLKQTAMGSQKQGQSEQSGVSLTEAEGGVRTGKKSGTEFNSANN